MPICIPYSFKSRIKPISGIKMNNVMNRPFILAIFLAIITSALPSFPKVNAWRCLCPSGIAARIARESSPPLNVIPILSSGLTRRSTPLINNFPSSSNSSFVSSDRSGLLISSHHQYRCLSLRNYPQDHTSARSQRITFRHFCRNV
jgi:hypothetical protein